MNLIAAVDRNWAIGSRGQLLVSIPRDQQFFRTKTLGKVVVMGRRTLESLPGKKPLYGRTSLVLTRNKDYQVKGAEICHSMDGALEFLKGYPQEDIYIIGGGSIYEQFLPYCDTAHVTYIDFAYAADAWLPNLDQDPEWIMKEESDEQTFFDLCYTYRRYERQKFC